MEKDVRLTKKKLGDLLVDVGIISPEQLQEGLDVQKREGGKLGELLIRLGYVSEDILLAFLGKQCGVQYISLSEYGEIAEDIIGLVPETITRHQMLIPVQRQGNILTIAMADPLNVFATDDLKLMTGCDIRVVIASESEINECIDRYYGPKKSMEDIVRDIEAQSEGGSEVDIVKETEADNEIISLEAQGEDAPVVKIVNLLLSSAVRAKASDVHIEPYEKNLRVRFRIDGVLHEQPAPPKKLQNAIVSRFKIMAQMDIAERRLPQDGRIRIRVSEKEVDLRVSILPTSFGEKIVLRLLDSSGLRLDLTKLGFEPDALRVYQKNITVPYGIILVTGPTGSGKSTTLYSTLSALNYPDRNIITIEDPVEYVIEGINQVQARPDIGLTFAAGLRSFLRQDPDIILVGEIRDSETGEIAIKSALTGHLVFSTLHTNDAPGAVTRLTNMGIEPFLTASTVVVVVAQRLVRVICKHCREAYEVPIDYLISAGVKPELLGKAKKFTLYRGKGCADCSNTGYRGRLACYEVMEMNDELRELIIARSPAHLVKQVARKHGMLTLREAAVRKVLNGVTTIEEMVRISSSDEGKDS